MPKYIPTTEDIYEFTPCVICGEDTGDRNKDTCCWRCDYEKECFEDFMELSFMEDIYMEEQHMTKTNTNI